MAKPIWRRCSNPSSFGGKRYFAGYLSIPDGLLLQEDRLLVSDPKALQYIYHTSGYRFIKPPGRKELGRLATGTGIFFVEGLPSKFAKLAC